MGSQLLIVGLLSICQAQFPSAPATRLPSTTFGAPTLSGTTFGSTFPSTSLSSNPLSATSFGTTSLSSTTFPNNFFSLSSPSFAASSLPAPFPFPSGFTSQTLFLPAPSTIKSKKSSPGVYTPPSVKIPTDPAAASSTLLNLLTNSNDKVAQAKGGNAIKDLYDQNSFRSFNIEMTNGNWNTMNLDPTKELSVHCRLTADYNTPQAKTFSDFGVGCGYKGSVGSLRVCLDEYGRDNHVCRKLSLHVDAKAFKQKGVNQTAPLFYGMESLFFGGLPVDLAMVSERTAFALMNNLGMTASLASHAKLFLNGKYLGVYSFVQGVDEQFTKMHFANDDKKGKGGLYKELWLNPRHMKDIKDTYKSGAKEDAFLKQVMTAIDATPLTGTAPQQFFDKYFDVQSLIDMTAFNTAIGSSDDWRQRHNFFLYIRQLKKDKKIVFIPWDYDRLYDAGSDTRGVMKGQPWWDIKATATPMACNAMIISTQEQASATGGSPLKIAWNKGILDQLPVDMNIPVTCDKITQLMAYALGARIRQRTREMASSISMTRVRQLWTAWDAQIKTALEKDPSGPAYQMMVGQQTLLDQHFTKSLATAVSQANAGDAASGSVSTSFAASLPSSFSASPLPAFNSFSTPSFAASQSFAAFPSAGF